MPTFLRVLICFVVLPIAWFGLFLLLDPWLDAPKAIAFAIAIVSLASAFVGYLHKRNVWVATMYAAITAALSFGAFVLFIFTVITVACWGWDPSDGGECP